MTAYLASLAVGTGVGIAYALLGVKSPAPPVIALLGLLGMVGGEIACQRILTAVRHTPVPNEVTMSSKPIITAGYVDHVGMTVPDLTAAIRFFEDAIGAALLWRVGPFPETPTGVPIDGVELAMLRLGPNLNLELMAFQSDHQRREMPSNVDLGAMHIAFFVDDIEAAARSLAEHGAELLRGPIDAAGDVKKGERIWYFKTPWGAFLEILWRPDPLPYERLTTDRLFARRDLA